MIHHSLRGVLYFAFLSFVLVGGAQEKDRQYPLPVPVNVPIIKSPNVPSGGEVPFYLEKDFVLGNESDEHQCFNQISDIAVDDNGSLYVLDSRDCRLKKFDHYGKFVWAVGRRGQGPGEFQQPMHVFVTSQDHVYILDYMGQIKLHEYDKNGKYIRTVAPDIIGGIPIKLLGPETFIVQTASNRSLNPNYALDVINVSGKVLRRIIDIPALHLSYTADNLRLRNPFEPSIVFATFYSGGGVLGRTSDPRLITIDAQGNPVQIIERIRQALPVTKEDQSYFVERRLKNQEKYPGGIKLTKDEIRRAYDFDRYKYKPLYFRLYCDDKDRFYVEEWKQYSENDLLRHCEVYSKSGRFLFTTKIPYNVAVIRAGHLYVRETDAQSGYQHVIRWKIKNWESINEN